MKGISPIIATVLLIATTITIAILVTTWATDWVNEQTGSEDITCAVDTNYIVSSAEYNNTYNSTLLIKLTNKEKTGLYGFGVVIDNGTDILRFDATSQHIGQGGLSKNNKLGREKSVYITVNLTNSTAGHAAIGDSLKTSSDLEITVTNLACPAVSAKATAVT